MHSSTRKNQIQHKKGDTITDPVTKIRRFYDGHKWRRLCSISQCKRIVQKRNLCMRHFNQCHFQPYSKQSTRSFKLTSTDDLSDPLHIDDDSKESSFEQILTLVSPQVNEKSPQNCNESSEHINTDASSIPVSRTDTSSDVSSIFQNIQTIGADTIRCRYSISSNNVIQCQDVANSKCSHCSFFFCLQHGLHHQKELKDEARYLLAEAEKLFHNIERVNITSGQRSCAMFIDQWAVHMHSTIEQKRDELQMKLDQFDRQIEAKKNDWKNSFKTDLEIKVGGVLKELSEKYEIDGLKFNQAREDLIDLKKLFDLFETQQLISIANRAEQTMNFTLPQLNISSVLSNDIEWMRNFDLENTNSLVNQQKYTVKDHSITVRKLKKVISDKMKQSKTNKKKIRSTVPTSRPIASTTVNIENNVHPNVQEDFIENQVKSVLFTVPDTSERVENRFVRSFEDIEPHDKTTSILPSSSPVQNHLIYSILPTIQNNGLQTDIIERYMDDTLCHTFSNNNEVSSRYLPKIEFNCHGTSTQSNLIQ